MKIGQMVSMIDGSLTGVIENIVTFEGLTKISIGGHRWLPEEITIIE